FYDLKRYNDVLAANDRALALRPDLAPAWLCRADTLKLLRRNKEAIAAYRQALKFGGNVEIIKYSLAGLGEEPQPEAPPEHYVVSVFDSYAENFDTDLVHNLKYRIPVVIAGAIKQFVVSSDLD